MGTESEVKKAVARIEELLGGDPVLCELRARCVLGALMIYASATSRAMGLSIKGQHTLLQCANDEMDRTARAVAIAKFDAKLDKNVIAALEAALMKGDFAEFLKIALGAITPKPAAKNEVSGTEYARQGQVDAEQVAKVDAEADRIIAAALVKKPEPDKEG